MGAVDFGVVNSAVDTVQPLSNEVTYIKWIDKDRYDIGKYTSENGAAAATRSFKRKFPKFNESTARSFKKKYKEKLNESEENGTTHSKSIPKYKTKTGGTLMLGELDIMVKKYIQTLSNRGAVISRAGAIATATALLKKYPKIVGKIDLESSSWTKSLFMRMGYVRRKNTSSKVEIPDKARKEIEYQFHFDIVSKVEKYNIPDVLIINLDQTPSYLVLCKQFTMAPKGSTSVAIHGCGDKRTITAAFVITFAGEFLPIQLIYSGKTLQSLPRYQLPNSFSLSMNEKYYSNTNESLKLFNEIVIPYINEIRSSQNILDQYAPIIMDVFTGQKTTKVMNILKDNKILVTNIPANMTRSYQPLDLTMNGYAKKFTSRKFNSCYTDQISL